MVRLLDSIVFSGSLRAYYIALNCPAKGRVQYYTQNTQFHCTQLASQRQSSVSYTISLYLSYVQGVRSVIYLIPFSTIWPRRQSTSTLCFGHGLAPLSSHIPSGCVPKIATFLMRKYMSIDACYLKR